MHLLTNQIIYLLEITCLSSAKKTARNAASNGTSTFFRKFQILKKKNTYYMISISGPFFVIEKITITNTFCIITPNQVEKNQAYEKYKRYFLTIFCE